MIPIEQTSIYPTRYAAFDRNDVLFVHDAPKQSGGHEWAVFNDDTSRIYGSIVSYQDEGFLIEVVKVNRSTFCERMVYNYEHAQRKLIEELTKAIE